MGGKTQGTLGAWAREAPFVPGGGEGVLLEPSPKGPAAASPTEDRNKVLRLNPWASTPLRLCPWPPPAWRPRSSPMRAAWACEKRSSRIFRERSRAALPSAISRRHMSRGRRSRRRMGRGTFQLLMQRASPRATWNQSAPGPVSCATYVRSSLQVASLIPHISGHPLSVTCVKSHHIHT